jgi:hypothetical protein
MKSNLGKRFVLVGGAILVAALMWLADERGAPAPHASAPDVGIPASAEVADDPGSAAPAGAPGEGAAIEGRLACAVQLAERFPDRDPPTDDYTAAVREWVAPLDPSRNPEHHYAAALLELDAGRRTERIAALAAQPTPNALLAWHALRVCSEMEAPTTCELPKLEAQLLALDGENAEVWMRVAMNRLARGEDDAALAAVERAAAAAEIRSYWPETIAMIERALAAAGTLAFADRANAAFGAAARNFPSFSDALGACRDRLSESDAWARACLAYGRLAEQRHDTEIGQRLGLSFQTAAHEALGDDEERLAAEQRLAAARAESSALTSPFNIATMLVLSDPARFAAYLDALRQYGERGARARMRDDVDLIFEQEGLGDCLPWLEESAAQEVDEPDALRRRVAGGLPHPENTDHRPKSMLTPTDMRRPLFSPITPRPVPVEKLELNTPRDSSSAVSNRLLTFKKTLKTPPPVSNR